MRSIDIFNFLLSCVSLYTIFIYLLGLLPRNRVPLVSTSLNEAMALLEHAEAINIPNASDYRAKMAILHNQFLQMRTESHRSSGFFQQLALLALSGLTWRLYLLNRRIESIRRKIELVVDERRLASLINGDV